MDLSSKFLIVVSLISNGILVFTIIFYIFQHPYALDYQQSSKMSISDDISAAGSHNQTLRIHRLLGRKGEVKAKLLKQLSDLIVTYNVQFSQLQNYGLAQLQAGYEERRGLRQILCSMTLLAYNLIITFFLSHSDGDLDWCEQALTEQLECYPNSVWFLFFKARLEFTKGNLDDSIEWYVKSWKSQQLWPQFHNLCFWELMWAHCVKQEWQKALKYAETLSTESNWSRTIYLYQQAALMIMSKPSPDSKEKSQVDQLMTQVPTHKQRIAGKSLPMEKFVIKKTERYFAQKKKLVLPVFELMYVWNLFKIVGKNENTLLSIFKTIEEEEVALKTGP